MSNNNYTYRRDQSLFANLQASETQKKSFLELIAPPSAEDEISLYELSERGFNKSMCEERIDMLYSFFYDVLQTRTQNSEVFETLQDLAQNCADVLQTVQTELQRAAARSNRQKQLLNLSWLQQELNTWKLLYALYKDRIQVQSEADGGMDGIVPLLNCSEREVVMQLYACNSTLREYQLIVDWLEACYTQADGAKIAQSFESTAVGWSNTLFQLHKQKHVAFSSGAEIVKSLDPDANIREKRPLHALDEEDNARLSKAIFIEIRQGRIEEAMALCKNSGQTWRAAILEGWRLHENPNYDAAPNMREKMPIEGNPRRDLWKKCAWLMADSGKYDDYTRAIAGAFCGHLESLKSLLCNSWEDMLWAYLKVQIDIRVESELRAVCLKSYLKMPEAYWNAKMSLEQIFDELHVHKDAAVREHASSKMGIIQKYLILDNIGELLQQMRRWLDESSGTSDDNQQSLPAHLLRFLTHVVLFLRQIERIDKEDIANRIIAAYVECLISLADAQLVAFYTAMLPLKQQVLLYSKFLQNIDDKDLRVQAFHEAQKAALDVEQITRHTVEVIRQRLPNSAGTAVAADAQQTLQVGDISAFDLHKIRALQWLTFLPTQNGELLWQANAMIRYFLAENKLECVSLITDMVPKDAIAQILQIYGSVDDMPCRENCSVKEFLSYKTYLAAIDAFNDWNHLYHNRPKQPQTKQTDAKFTERIASEHKEQVYHAELNRWTAKLEQQTEFTRAALFNILVMPERGWCIDPDVPKDNSEVSEAVWEHRQIQLDKLRSICIPEIVLLLHKVLHLSGDHKGCIKLADEIACETKQLYKVYTKHKLAELLAKLAASSLELLNTKLDAWGYVATV